MGRSYSDNSYATKQTIAIPDTGALNGTAAGAAVVSRFTFMQPSELLDIQAFMVAGGTNANGSITIGRSLAGTGATVALGTIAVGTSATGVVIDGAVVGGTTCYFNTGDDIVVERALGTTTTVENYRVFAQYRERFVVSDS